MSNRFVVDLSGVKLAKGMEEKLARNIQQAVLTGLAETHTQPEMVLRFPKEWLGLILHLDQRQLPAIEKEIGGLMR
ncbi:MULTISPECIES: hypothetical protein [Phyllobacteriaceae]|jgi:hypothetical protein|uniref:Uncharacterized protein n=1 Tax=Mesorhizobium hungaricum TaxID=1566387 RepID=A0A1C2EAX5_9HYPH|nr:MULTISPECIES: hypothetical protein [Mesorhizobium]MBN9235231.1 hypothetical protein [Mesorhizobium sp.]MDQ0332848.1 hypothetical protein [Mesorhizobium sp. YL-MeA3-2017]OCX24158.1 hypothetical protein QV13_02545 [Mesorhizobium hungaricum]